jgi:hypothetical protein
MRGVKHSSDEVLAAVIKANKKGTDLRTSAVKRGPYRWCYRSSIYYWKSWRDVLREAGIKYSDLQERAMKPKRKKFITALQEAYAGGMDLSASSMQNSGCGTLYEMAKTLFANEGQFFWEKALEAANLPVDDIVRQRNWDKDRVKEELQKRYLEGKPIHACALMKEASKLYRAMVNNFESTDEGYRYSGFNPDEVRKVRRPYTIKEMKAKVKEMAEKGVDLNRESIMDGDNLEYKRLVMTADKLVGGWYGLVDMSKIDKRQYVKRQRDWNKDKVHARLREAKEKGEPLAPGYIAEHHSDLYHAAGRYAGGIRVALSEAFPPEEDAICATKVKHRRKPNRI